MKMIGIWIFLIGLFSFGGLGIWLFIQGIKAMGKVD